MSKLGSADLRAFESASAFDAAAATTRSAASACMAHTQYEPTYQ